jgi:hypothetical protein
MQVSNLMTFYLQVFCLVATSIEKWPPKLQHLDLDGNSLSSLKPLLGVCSCEVVRYFDVCSGRYAPSRLIRDDRQVLTKL